MTAEPVVLAAVVEEFRFAKRQAERAITHAADDDPHFRLHGEQCSIAPFTRHSPENMRSRWTDFLTTNDEKPDRNREAEFAETPATRRELIVMWDRGWAVLFATLESLGEGDSSRTVLI